MSTEVKVPVLPESVSDATIASWHKKAGEIVKRDENIVDLETDKVVLEVPSPVDGVLKEIKFDAGSTVTSNQVLAIIEEGSIVTAPSPAPSQVIDQKPVAVSAPAAKSNVDSLPPGARFTATTEGIDPAQIEGSGRRGAVTKEDIINFAKQNGAARASGTRLEERIPMTRIRQRIAERLMQSKNSTAMLTTFNEINLAKVSNIRKELQEEFQKAHGIKLGFMSFFVKAAANALQRFPLVNASIDGTDIIYHGYSDISIAVSTDKGLVTPVLRNVERMSFADIEHRIADYAKKARDGKLSLEELQGGTFTVTNGGTFGSLLSTPIVNPPQSAILGMHTIKERPIAENGNIVIAPMMYVALSYDHRIIDGKDSVQFLVDIKNQLEDPGRMLFGL
ncbi:dihydrolipoyllysine-residue succinyltransferase [Xylella fastidiosa subsp. fastidiosa]|jgi:2-oxoglutarate dehydrogenase E2 component (dihydrolipoamide succinyltransferase)|uniref:Dihydrolipoyllysine-residue succinyltransferase component of 2-oxoglutarate dehydrogenase complex n=2 Tax=Xylella fastidiosa TaxID=2371 RepID=Q87DC6_XYLFT|nr:dihydrolipoyllysine-residue succinyltransferase [Xylella fastidiosa]ADN63771.1 dihydrolipoamide succinyltransferase [Xylella fastidiosa subsp. fastidiosa GB514]KAF0570634.1 dihydrolipoamide succinyltransferase [Xylella fastidiosa subsp. fastidiosa Mus-1]AAO28628.1 dihydrolipoamide S-succinyltransferase [Xylella fastidiosa Temecula1]ACB92241.1 2-oxoglutarate dehydrogenase, E2 subunit, dihydrolipoamide succinyltransferase [Xylella fastidiosa M23]EGO82708.1 Dihydrolipoamide acyltransferase [Xy